MRRGFRKNRERISISYRSEEDHDEIFKKIRNIEKQIKKELGSDYEGIQIRLFPTKAKNIFESESDFPKVDEKNDEALENLVKMAEGMF